MGRWGECERYSLFFPSQVYYFCGPIRLAGADRSSKPPIFRKMFSPNSNTLPGTDVKSRKNIFVKLNSIPVAAQRQIPV